MLSLSGAKRRLSETKQCQRHGSSKPMKYRRILWWSAAAFLVLACKIFYELNLLINPLPYLQLLSTEETSVQKANSFVHHEIVPTLPSNLSSLEMLDLILKDNNKFKNLTSSPPPDCLQPNTKRTQALVEAVESGKLSLLNTIVLNMGMPKAGSSTLYEFFKCSGLKARHQMKGHCMHKAIDQGLPPVYTCGGRNGVQGMFQLDSNFPPNRCFFPQMSLLAEIHAEHPNATFLLNFRPVDSWIKSARNWQGMAQRWVSCDLPGLPEGVGEKDDDLRRWFCGHVLHVREFVAQHPSHALIELDLYNGKESSQVLSKLFHTNATCWGHANAKMTQSQPTSSP